MNILTFDIEDWFHILDNNSTRSELEWTRYPSRIHRNVDLIFKLLEPNNQKATFFCLGWIAEKYPEIVRKIVDNGHELGSHSYYHQLVYEMTPEGFKSDMKRTLNILEDLSGKKIKYYRAPGFSITDDSLWALEILSEFGIEADSSVFPSRHGHGGMPFLNETSPFWIDYKGIRIKEFPLNYKRICGFKLIFSGGGYFRLIPLALLKNFTNSSEYLMSYFHPRDFDPEQPKLKELNPLRNFKSYVGLAGSQKKLEALLEDFSFVDLSEAINLIDWAKVKIVKF
jgi:polysaccharide deacetylase family protein (PEP-CTERM system associated)